MKKQKLFFEYSIINIARILIICITLLLLMIGCTPSETQLTRDEPAEVAESLTMTKVPKIPTGTSTPIFTQTIEPITVVPSVTPTASPSETPTVMPIATLTITERQALFQELMLTNGGCDLPCWWGFELGNSLESINQIFINLGMPWLKTNSSYKVESDQMGIFNAGYIDENGTRVSYRLNVFTEYHELDNSVDYIYTYIDRPNSEIGQQEFFRDWEQYYLSSFLKKYGKPSHVYFRIRSVADLMIPPQFSVSLLYLDKGLAITYHIEATWLDEEYTQAELCLPIENVRALELSLFNPDGFDRWGYQFAPYHDEHYETLTWEAEFGTSLDSFYETYKDPSNLECFLIDG